MVNRVLGIISWPVCPGCRDSGFDGIAQCRADARLNGGVIAEYLWVEARRGARSRFAGDALGLKGGERLLALLRPATREEKSGREDGDH